MSPSTAKTEERLEKVAGRLSPRSKETMEKIMQPLVDGQTHDELAGELGIEKREVARAVDELRSEARAIEAGAELVPLSNEEREGMKESLKRLGQLQPILVDEKGEMLDGHHRKQLLEELGVEPETKMLLLTGPQQKHEVRLAANAVRSSLSTAERRAAVEAEILHDPRRADRAIAATIGVSNHTVAAARKRLEERGALLRLDARIGADGSVQPARKPPRAAPPAAGAAPAAGNYRLLLDLTDTAGGRVAFTDERARFYIPESDWFALDRPIELRVQLQAVVE